MTDEAEALIASLQTAEAQRLTMAGTEWAEVAGAGALLCRAALQSLGWTDEQINDRLSAATQAAS